MNLHRIKKSEEGLLGSYYSEGKRKVILQEKWKKVIFSVEYGKKMVFFLSNGPHRLFKNDFFFGPPFDIGFDAKCKNPKKSFYDKIPHKDYYTHGMLLWCNTQQHHCWLLHVQECD